MIELKNVAFHYAGDDAQAAVRNGVYDINLTIQAGETILLCGESGCGKTTLTRLINGLIPHFYEGTLSGEVVVDGKIVAETPLYEMAKSVGSVFQNPRSQFFNVDTDGELAFACENMGLAETEVRTRVAQTVRELSLGRLLGRSIFKLSGGEKQKIACGSVSALSPDIFVLDEPTSNLDVDGIHTLKEVIRHWKAEGKTVIISEHRLSFLCDLADRVFYLKDGALVETHRGDAFFKQPPAFFSARGLRRVSFDAKGGSAKAMDVVDEMKLKDFFFRYGKGDPGLNIDALALPLGHAIAVIGRNGAGKTTFVRSLCGLLKKDRSQVYIGAQRYTAKKRLSLCYMVMQDVNHQLFTESVLDEVLLSMPSEDVAQAEALLASLDLLSLKERHPMSLSGGQKQRIAIASALAAERQVLILDEPTSGLDLKHMQQVAENIHLLKQKGKTVIVVTHDPHLIRACCEDVLHMEAGAVRDFYALDDIGTVKLNQFFAEEDTDADFRRGFGKKCI